MGARGPVGASAETLKIRGDHRWRSRAKNQPLELPVEKPSCPKWLGKEAKAEWRRVSAELFEAGSIAKVDRAVLAIYCEAWGEFVQLGWELSELKRTKAERAAQEPEAREADDKAEWHLRNARHKATQRVATLAQQLGLTPASRPRVKASSMTPVASNPKSRFFRQTDPAADDDELERFMDGDDRPTISDFARNRKAGGKGNA